jgi:hypothetical protein
MGVMPKRDKTLTDFGRNVSRLRSDAGFLQNKLAEKVDLNPQMAQMNADSKNLTVEHCRPMVRKKIRIWLSELLWETNWFALVRKKILFQCGLRKEAFQLFAQNDLQVFVQGY